MSEHGGYRRPRNPAAVSGPGKHSRRTDGGPGVTYKQAARYIQGDEYGESKELTEIAASADLAAAPAQGNVPSPEGAPPRNPELPDPTQRPDEPVTAGIGEAGLPQPMSLEELAVSVRAAYIARPSLATRKLLEKIEALDL